MESAKITIYRFCGRLNANEEMSVTCQRILTALNRTPAAVLTAKRIIFAQIESLAVADSLH